MPGSEPRQALLKGSFGHLRDTPCGNISETGCNAALDAQGGQLLPIGHRHRDGDGPAFFQ